ncbi:hypothetical protein OG937_13220 [Streptomyces sp. NBC_00510]
MEDRGIREALDRHWAASAAGDQDIEHEIYHDDVITDYPQSGERIHGRRNLQALRSGHPPSSTSPSAGFSAVGIFGSPST